VLGIDLDAKAVDVGSGLTKCALIIGRQIMALRHPLIEVGVAGFADNGEDVNQRNGAGILGGAFGGGSIPDVRKDAAVGKSDQKLGSLVIGGGMAEIAARGSWITFQRQVRKGISAAATSTFRSRAKEALTLLRWRQEPKSSEQVEKSGCPWFTLICQSEGKCAGSHRPC